jgi:hypothetical protein
VSTTYRFTSPESPSLAHTLRCVKHALRDTIHENPGLCYGVSEDSQPAFVRIPIIKWEDVVDVKESDLCIGPDGITDADADSLLAKRLEIAHTLLFSDPESKPSWRITVIPYHGQESRRLDVIFACHHALADGLSGLAFHRCMLKHIQRYVASSVKGDVDEMDVFETNNAPWPSVVEDHIHLPLSSASKTLPDTLKDTLEEELNPIWPNTEPKLPPKEKYRSRVLLAMVPPESLTTTLSTCKRLGITLTGLLHGLVVSHLARSLPKAQRFGAISPFSMRRFTQASPDEIVNHIWYIVSKFSGLEEFRACVEGSAEEMELIAKIGKQFSEEMNAQLARLPESNPLTQVAEIPDVLTYCQASMTAKRNLTYEISNLGVFRSAVSATKEGREGVDVEKVVFSQCGMINPPIGLNVVSHEKGPLVVTFTWQDGSVEAELMESLAQKMRSRLMALNLA